MGMKVKEIADLLGLSPSAVSLVINNRPGVGAATRERVRRTLAELGYGADKIDVKAQVARGTLLFVMYRRHGVTPDGTPYFSQLFSEIIESVERQAKLRGYNLMVSSIDEKHIDAQLEDLRRTVCEGRLLLATEMSEEQIARFEDKPLVLIDNYVEGRPHDSVKINNELGVYQAIRYLSEMGHTRIGYIHVDGNANNFTERYYGFVRAMDRCGLPFSKADVFTVSTENGGEAVSAELKRLLSSAPSLPTALFADNDIVASCALKVLREMGLSVPADVSLIGFDNAPFAAMLDPPLTTIRVPREKIGITAVNTIIDALSARRVEGSLRIEIATQPVLRDSVASPKV